MWDSLFWITIFAVVITTIFRLLRVPSPRERKKFDQIERPSDTAIILNSDTQVEGGTEIILSHRADVERPAVLPGGKDVQEVMFVTNRLSYWDGPLTVDGIFDRVTGEYRYGRAWVNIPGRHKLGAVERPKFNWLRLRREAQDPAKHFMLSDLIELAGEDFFQALRSSTNSALVFVHGYNVSFVDAIFRAAQIGFDTNFPGKVVAFSWPSQASLRLYDTDREMALASGRDFCNVLKSIKAKSEIKNVFVVAHSLGSQIVIDALQIAADQGVDLNLKEVIFAAPDVDREVFRSRSDLMKRVAAGLTLYASSADNALRFSKLKAGGPRAGDMPAIGPLLIDGIDLIDVTALGDDLFALNHNVGLSQRSILDDLGRVVMSGTRPPHVRTTTLQRMPDRNTVKYWMAPP